MNEEQKFYVDEFYNEVMYEINRHSHNKQERFKIVYQMINTLMHKSELINDTQLLTNGLVMLLAFLNDRPVDGFQAKRMISPQQHKVLKILLNEVIPN